MKPRFEHDCDACRLLAQTDSADWYYCPNGETLIKRYSDDGEDYTTFPLSLLSKDRDSLGPDWALARALSLICGASETKYG